ncbi:MAG: response regulator, partial [Tannerella sp.]|nr:response regulator [Tannerella sp.]
MQKYIFYFVTVWIALWTLPSAHSMERLRFEWITDRNGLSQNTVRCLMQDAQGFMWMGTINGLNRYNGKEFSVMLSEQGNPLSLPDNRVRSMMSDTHGYIWIRTTADLFGCYNPYLERFENYDPGSERKSFSSIRVCSGGDVWLWGRSDGCCRIRHEAPGLHTRRFDRQALGSSSVSFVYENSRQQVWVGTDAGTFRMEGDSAVKMSGEAFYAVHEWEGCLYFINGRQVQPFDLQGQTFGHPAALPGGQPRSLTVTAPLHDGLILIGARDGVVVFDTKRAGFIPSSTFFGRETLRSADVYVDNRGDRWIYNHSGCLWRLLPDNRFEPVRLIPESILSTIDAERYEVYHDSHDIIWITTYGNGLFALDPRDGRMYHYTAHNSDLLTNYLLCVTEDQSGEIWVGTEFSGITKISLSNYPFRIHYPEPAETGNRSNAVRLIYEDARGRYWMGTRSGRLHIYDSALRKLRSHRIEGSLPFCLAEDSLGNVWLGTRGGGLVVFPPSGQAPVRQFHLHDIDRQNTSSDNVFDLLRDTRNRLWVASFGGGLHYADLNEDKIEFRHINARTVNQDMVRVIVQDRTGLIWTGTNEGVNVFDPDELIRDPDRYINFHSDRNDERSINNNEVKAIFEDSKGRLWFGTTGGGLNLLVREEPLERSRFKHYTAADGLSNELVQTIIEDAQGYIWMTTEGGSGISRFNPDTERFENFSFADGKQTALFNDASRWRTKAGELMFGSYNGVYIFDPAQIRDSPSAQPVIITGLRINGENMRPGKPNSPLTESITYTEAIRLKYNQSSFDIEFAMLNFRSPDFNRYACYLEGFEADWNPASRHNIATYRNVPAGTYTFKVKGSNSLGVWVDSNTTLKITVTPPFWKSFWAYVVYCVLLLVAAGFALRIVMQINRLHTDMKVEHQLTEHKLRFFTNISHEFRTPLTIIRGSIENLTALTGVPAPVARQVHQISKSAARLLRLIDQLLEFRRLQNHGLELTPERTEVVSFFRDICQIFEEMAEKKEIDFRFESDLEAREMLLDRSKFDKIAYNLLSNAMRHTPEKGIIIMRLTFSEATDGLTLSVSDSGAGVPEEKQSALFVRFARFDQLSSGMGIGLHLTAELAAVHKGRVIYSVSELGGACFSVTVPLANRNYESCECHREEVKTTPAPLPAAAAVAMAAAEEAKPLPEALTEASASLNKRFSNCKLLVIEDDDDVRDFIRVQMDGSFTLFTAKDGEEGLEKAMKEQPTLIICDVMMPGIDGFEVTRRLKEDFLTSHIPVILLTAHSSEEHRLEGIQAGADSYITKPFSIQYLLARIVKLIEQREKLQRKFEQEPGATAYLLHCTEKDREFIDSIHLLIQRH